MAATFERDKASPGNSGGQPAPFLKGLCRVAATVQDEGRNFDLGQEIVDVEGVDRPQDVGGITPWRTSASMQS